MEHMVWCGSGELVSESDDNLTSRPAYSGQRIVLMNPSKSKTIRQKRIQVAGLESSARRGRVQSFR